MEVYKGLLPFPSVFVWDEAGVEVVDGGLEMILIIVIMSRGREGIPLSVVFIGSVCE